MNWQNLWTNRLGTQGIVVAEVSGNIVGFMSLAGFIIDYQGGYIDFAYNIY